MAISGEAVVSYRPKAVAWKRTQRLVAARAEHVELGVCGAWISSLGRGSTSEGKLFEGGREGWRNGGRWDAAGGMRGAIGKKRAPSGSTEESTLGRRRGARFCRSVKKTNRIPSPLALFIEWDPFFSGTFPTGSVESQRLWLPRVKFGGNGGGGFIGFVAECGGRAKVIVRWPRNSWKN